MADEKKEKSLELDSAISSFLLWCHDNDLKLNNKVSSMQKGSCHRYGMVAMEDISPDECLFKVPRGLLLEPKTCGISKILTGKVIQNMLSQHEGWVPLLLALMYEYTNPTSLWKPYMDIVPGIDILDQPMFWPDETRQSLLQGTGFEDDVEDDKQRIERQYFTVAVPIMKKFKKFFDLKRHSLSLYKHMAAFIMAYSFTEDSPSFHGNNVPVMVPMADILNHHSNNNARLEFGEEELSMVSTQHILKGGEVFNTYGQLANCHLLQSYGFVEGPDNPNDTVSL
ncbi:predicted protein [Nematostella vectensis]|uniref:SET domain-containing protein n=1 Tax=Nematostella vectensis TaxID=45351 RepID=A7SES5_NEMVE|nr:predicted protein [Nematostella vectensis]|eukprot:XP_001629819.1 predicted protein [Nematostella vectensis]